MFIYVYIYIYIYSYIKNFFPDILMDNTILSGIHFVIKFCVQSTGKYLKI